MKAEEYSERKATLAGWPVNVVTYRIGSTYHATVENTDPGAWVVKAQAGSKAEAEATAVRDAGALLKKVATTKPPTGCTSVPGF
jgi:hypothetical protein